jgi:uncharacterized protein
MSHRARWLYRSLAPALAAWFAACGGTKMQAPGQPSDTGLFFDNAGARLSYVVDRPSGAGPFPGIVLVHEGGQVVKGSLAGLAATLVQHGFVVLRYDKRGVGQSTGTFEEVSTDNSERVIALLASDVVAAVRTLRAQAGVDGARVGLVGASQAGWVMPLAASQIDVRFFAAVVGPAVAVGPLYYYAGLAGSAAYTLDDLSQLLAAYTGPTGFDPAPVLQSLNIPAFWQMATDDRTVPTRESVAIVNGLTAAGKPYVTKLYPGGHELRNSTTYVPDLLAWLDTVR